MINRRKPRNYEIANPLDINQIVNQTMADITHTDFLQKIIRTRMEETLNSIFRDFFREYSDFGKALKEEVQNKLQINFDRLDLPSYNHLIAGMLQQLIDVGIKEEGIAKLKELVEGSIQHADKEYKMSEIVERIKKDARDDDDEISGEITFLVDRSFSYWIDVRIDPEPDRDKYACKYRFQIDAKTNKVEVIEVDHKVIDIKSLDRGYGFERELFYMFAAGSKLIVDEDHVDLYYSGDDY